jgi:hypothetical protein
MIGTMHKAGKLDTNIQKPRGCGALFSDQSLIPISTATPPLPPTVTR